MLRDQNWIAASDFGEAFAQRAIEIYETSAADILNNATGTSVATGEDGLAICASTHTDPDGSTITGFDNLHALSLTHENLSTVRTAIKRIPGYDSGTRITMKPDELWVPPELEDAAKVILQSVQASGGNNNDVNVHANSMKLYVWNYLTDTNRWFVTDSLRRRMNAHCYVSWPLEIVSDTAWSQLTRRIGAYTRFVFGVKNTRFITASEAS